MVDRQVGDVATNYHAVSLKIKSVLDSTNAECDDEIADEGRDSTVAAMDTTDDESQVSLSSPLDSCCLAHCDCDPGKVLH